MKKINWKKQLELYTVSFIDDNPGDGVIGTIDDIEKNLHLMMGSNYWNW